MLAIGLVVDDAIVVVENIQRRIDEGEPPMVAASAARAQVFFAVVATTVVLIAVFAPLMFLAGATGRLFVELAVASARPWPSRPWWPCRCRRCCPAGCSGADRQISSADLRGSREPNFSRAGAGTALPHHALGSRWITGAVLTILGWRDLAAVAHAARGAGAAEDRGNMRLQMVGPRADLPVHSTST